MGMRCQAEKRKEREMTEQRSRRLKAAVAQWVNVIDEAQAISFAPDDGDQDLEKTLRISLTTSRRAH